MALWRIYSKLAMKPCEEINAFPCSHVIVVNQLGLINILHKYVKLFGYCKTNRYKERICKNMLKQET